MFVYATSLTPFCSRFEFLSALYYRMPLVKISDTSRTAIHESVLIASIKPMKFVRNSASRPTEHKSLAALVHKLVQGSLHWHKGNTDFHGLDQV